MNFIPTILIQWFNRSRYNSNKVLLGIFIFFVGTFNASAQSNDSLSAETLVHFYYKEAKACYNRAQYDSSYKYFKLLFAQQAWIPDEAAYHYGKTQLERKKYLLSKNAFVKYLKLKGTKANFSDSSLYYLTLIDCKINGFTNEEITCQQCSGTGTSKVKCEKCKGIGKIYCTVCSGKGVVVSVNGMNESYQRCQKCQGTGVLVCPTCAGTLYSDGDCPTCHGVGTVSKKKPCTH
jgi:RecJ-like exonuclease